MSVVRKKRKRRGGRKTRWGGEDEGRDRRIQKVDLDPSKRTFLERRTFF